MVIPGPIAQSVANPTADPYVSLIPTRSHTFVEIDHEIISTVLLIVTSESMCKNCLTDLSSLPRKKCG